MSLSNLTAGDYLIVSGIGITLKPKLIKFLETRGKSAIGYIDDLDDMSQKSVSFDMKDIVANLGKYPKAGTVYGVKVEPLVRTIKDKRFGEIRIYQKMKDETLELLMEELRTFYTQVKQRGHLVPYELEVRNPVGKYAGYYKYRPQADTDILCVRPENDLLGIQYILGHEHGHGIYNRRYTARLHNRWIKLYHEYVALTEVTEEDLNQILEEIQVLGHIGDYLKDAEDETKSIVKACLRYINQVHGLNKRHLETALSIQESIGDYWPVTPLDFSEKEVIVTEYGRKSVEELHSEVYAFWSIGRPLPKKVKRLLEDTLSKLTK